MTRKEAVDFLITKPYLLGHALGFNKLTELHNKWIVNMITDTNDKSLMAHRASYKSTCVSIALAIIILLFPNKRTLFMRKTDNDVREIVKQVQNILRNPYIIYFVNCIYGVNLKLDVSSSTEIKTNLTTDLKGTPQLVGIGTSASLTGKHFDFIFTDDIINVNDRVSRAERERTKIVYQELQNIKNRDGRIFANLKMCWNRFIKRTKKERLFHTVWGIAITHLSFGWCFIKSFAMVRWQTENSI